MQDDFEQGGISRFSCLNLYSNDSKERKGIQTTMVAQGVEGKRTPADLSAELKDNHSLLSLIQLSNSDSNEKQDDTMSNFSKPEGKQEDQYDPECSCDFSNSENDNSDESTSSEGSEALQEGIKEFDRRVARHHYVADIQEEVSTVLSGLSCYAMQEFGVEGNEWEEEEFWVRVMEGVERLYDVMGEDNEWLRKRRGHGMQGGDE